MMFTKNLSGNKPELKELLKMLQKGIEIRSAHSRISLAEILSRPVALDLDNLFKERKDITTTNWTENEFVVAANNVIGIT